MFKRVDELMADFRVIKLMGSKPNYAELGRKYGLDPRTVKKYQIKIRMKLRRNPAPVPWYIY